MNSFDVVVKTKSDFLLIYLDFNDILMDFRWSPPPDGKPFSEQISKISTKNPWKSGKSVHRLEPEKEKRWGLGASECRMDGGIREIDRLLPSENGKVLES